MPRKHGVGRIRKKGRQGSGGKPKRSMPMETAEKMPAARFMVDVADDVVGRVLSLVLDGEINAVLIQRDKDLNAIAEQTEIAWRADDLAYRAYSEWCYDRTTDEGLASNWDHDEHNAQLMVARAAADNFMAHVRCMQKAQAAWGEHHVSQACGCWRPCDCDQEAAAARLPD